MRGTLLIVDDQPAVRRALARELEDAGFRVIAAGDGAEAWELFRSQAPDAVVTDLRMPRSDGHDLLCRVRSSSDIPVIVFSARASVEAAVAAMKAGADDFVSSRELDIEELVQRVVRAIAQRQVPSVPAGLEQRLVGTSPAMARVRERIAALAPLRAPVLVSGERGSGRDAVVRALHDHGSSAHGHLARVPAQEFSPGGGLPEASAIYLDGVHALTPEAQAFWASWIREAQAREFREPPRLFASTTDPLMPGLPEPLDRGLQRQLWRFRVEIPSLSERPQDIPELAQALVHRIGTRLGRRVELSDAVRQELSSLSWPGNVAELERALECAVAYSRGSPLRSEALRGALAELERTGQRISLERLRKRSESHERRALIEALEAAGGNISQAAERLGRSRSTLYRLIEKHGLAPRPGR